MEEKGRVTRVMFSPETGEQVGEMYEGDRILRSKSKEYLASTQELLPNEPYIKAFNRVMFAVSSGLTGAELQMAYAIAPFLSFESGMLKHENGQPLSRHYIADYTGLSIQTVDRILQGLKEKQVIGRNVVGREVQYFMNPWIFMRGKRVNKTLHDMFKNSRWAKVYNL